MMDLMADETRLAVVAQIKQGVREARKRGVVVPEWPPVEITWPDGTVTLVHVAEAA